MKFKLFFALFLIMLGLLVIFFFVGRERDKEMTKVFKNIEIIELKAKYVTGMDKDFKKSRNYNFGKKNLSTISLMIRNSKMSFGEGLKLSDYSYHFEGLDKITNKKVNFRLDVKGSKYIFMINSTTLKFRNDHLGEFIISLIDNTK